MEFPGLPGIRFYLSLKDSIGTKMEDLKVLPDGRIFQRLYSGTSVDIDIEVFDLYSQYFPFTINYFEKGRLRTPIPSSADVVDNEDGSKSIWFNKRVPIELSRSNNITAYSQKNNIRILRIEGDSITIHTVAIIAQNNGLWLTADLTYRAEIKGDVIEYQGPHYWPTLFKYISKLFNKEFSSREVAENLPSEKEFDEKTATVIWWDSSEAHAGTGCVMTNEGQGSVHWTNIKRGDNSRKFLRVGEKITYRHKRGRDDDSDFPFELVGVRPAEASI